LQKHAQAGQHVFNGGCSTNVELGGKGQPHLVQSIARSPSPPALNNVAVHNEWACLPLQQLELPLCEPRFPGSWDSMNQRQNTVLVAALKDRAHASVDFSYFLHPADKQPFRADACVHAGFH